MRRRFRPLDRFLWEPLPTERLEVVTTDGLNLAVHRVKGDGPPILLLHGLGSNRHALHFPGRSLATWLSERGFDCYLAELRGAGDSERRAFDWDIDDYLRSDLPAIIEAILAHSGASSLSWIGHSMGGVLLYCYGIMYPDAPIARGVTVASALDYRVGKTGFKALLKLRRLIELLPVVPYGTFVHLCAPLMGRRFVNGIEAFNVWPSNIEGSMNRAMHAAVFHSIPVSLLVSLATMFEERGLCTREGDLHFVEQSDRFRVPSLLIGGSKDAQVSVDAIRATARLFGDSTRVRIFGKEYGEEDEYGHFDLLLGARAPSEVWPEIEAWLHAPSGT